MQRGRPRRQPSGRNLELYHELVCEERAQAEVAARFRVSQPRVAQVRRDVGAWVESMLPANSRADLPADPGRRLHLAIALRRLEVTGAYGEYLEHFGGARGAAGYGHLLAAWDAGVLPPEIAALLPHRDFVHSAVRMARELEDLARVAQRGPYFHLPGEGRESAVSAANGAVERS
jgi:hypothetical protein